MTGAAVIAGGRRFTGALTCGAAQQPTITVRGMTEVTIHLVDTLDGVVGMNILASNRVMAIIASCATRRYLEGVVIGVAMGGKAGSDGAVAVGTGIGSVARMTGGAAYQDINRRNPGDRVGNGAETRMTAKADGVMDDIHRIAGVAGHAVALGVGSDIISFHGRMIDHRVGFDILGEMADPARPAAGMPCRATDQPAVLVMTDSAIIPMETGDQVGTVMALHTIFLGLGLSHRVRYFDLGDVIEGIRVGVDIEVGVAVHAVARPFAEGDALEQSGSEMAVTAVHTVDGIHRVTVMTDGTLRGGIHLASMDV